MTTAGTHQVFTGKYLAGVRLYHGQTYLQLSGANTLQASDGIYVTDGTAEGTRQIASGAFYLENQEVIDGRMYFAGYRVNGSYGLWESDGTADGTRLVTDIAPGPIEGNPQPFVDLNRTLLMSADDHGDHGQEIWRVTPDLVAPTITNVEFRPADGSKPAVKVRFSERVAASLTAGSLQLTNLTTGQDVSTANVMIAYDSATDTATFTFPTGLADGNYRLTLPAAATTDPSGNALAAAGSLAFYVLAGDANRDRKVDFNDLVPLAQNYNTTGGKTWAEGDFTGDGSVDFNDLVLLAQRYNTSLPVPGTAAAVSTSSASFAADWAAVTAQPTTTPTAVTPTPKKRPNPVFSTKPVPPKKPAPVSHSRVQKTH